MKIDTNLLVLDSNIFIDAHRRYYAFDIAPGFWKKLQEKAEGGLVKSISDVYDELQKGSKDRLADWAKESFLEYFEKCDATQVIAAYGDIINWAYNNYKQSAVAEFADVADSWLLAYAFANKATLVTNESKQGKTAKITIPDVCLQFGISYINVFDMLRELSIELL